MDKFRPTEYSPTTVAALCGVGNHELKALAYAALVEIDGGTTSDLANAVAENAGLREVKDAVRKYPLTYENYGFASSYPYVGSNGREYREYIPEHEADALPLVGSLLDWSEEHDLSLIPFIGVNSINKTSPINKLQILEGMVNGYAIREINYPGYKPRSDGYSLNHLASVRGLVSAGVVKVHENRNTFLVDDPVYRGNAPLERLTPSTVAVYGILRLAKKLNPNGLWTMDDLLGFAEDHSFITANQRARTRLSLSRAVSDKFPTTFPGAVSKIPIEPKEYYLPPGTAEAAADLVDRVKTIDTAGSRKKKLVANLAIEAFADPITASSIATRGISHSRYSRFMAA